ncbi:TetR/AcrR family transcriptional regulator [Enterococcus sp.]|uniref:TetR/AcrR family transcriptional regulator n=1 Tax=Enterococcus sp. TaxID=35783 RepID=UPI00290C91BC|nr:TetR/AcrR family transcriptional regulator [Enterococcus sp.]MDU5335220.1 TetR/AcrR family transcriptional regulator [Enterococcus sp.]
MRQLREKDTSKYNKIIDEVGKIILTEGISSVSMSKIAKATGISSSTIYVYFTDKDDVLKKVYLENKKNLADYLAKQIDSTITDDLQYIRSYMEAVYAFGQENFEALMIIDQFNHSPILMQLNISVVESYAGFEMLFERVDRAPAGIFKAVEPIILLTFGYTPIVMYLQAIKLEQIDPKSTTINQIIDMSIKAIT